MIGVGLSATLSGGRKARVNLDPMPALDLNFAANRSLPADYGPTLSFSRASTGTFFNSSGVLTSAAVNAPRFDHVYSGGSWVSRGLLVEEQRTNLCPNSDVLDNASWTKSATTISANSVNSPDGTANADKVVETATTAVHSLIRFDAGIASGTYTLSAFCKYAGRKYLVVRFNDYATDANAASVVVDLETGSITGAATAYGTFSAASATVTDVGNGWYRIALKAAVSSTGIGLKFSLSNDGTRDANGSANSYAGDGTSGAYVWGAQYELGSFSTSYIPTTTSSTRSADVCQITGSDFSGFYNQSEGAFVAEYDFIASPSNRVSPRVWYVSDGAYTNSISLQSGTNDSLTVYQSSSLQADISATAASASVSRKSSSAYKLNDFAQSFDGGSVLTDTAGNVPSVNRMDIGYVSDISGRILNGHISRLRYYPTRLSNATLQSLST